MAMAVAMVLLLLVLGAAARSDLCELRVARSCRDFQPRSEDISRLGWWLSPRCPRNPSVIPATLTDVIRLPDSYLVIADMPGVSSGNLRINASSNRLSFSGLVHDPTPQLPRFTRELYRGALRKLFTREFLLPRHVDSSRVSHSIDNGVLRITLPFDESHPRSSILPAAEEGEIGGVLPIRCICLCKIEQAKQEMRPERLASRWSERPPASCHANATSFTMQPLTDIFEGPGSFELVAEMPGVERDSIRVGVDCSSQEHEECIVSLSGAVEEGAMELEEESLRIERGPSRRVYMGRFAVLPREYSGANVTYRLEDGLLRATVHLPEGRVLRTSRDPSVVEML